MKKFVAGAFGAAFLGSSVLVAMPAAQAKPYVPGGIDTACGAFAVGKPKAGKETRIQAKINNKDEYRSEPKGTVTIVVEKLNGADSGTGSSFTRGGAVVISVGKLKPGNYTGSVSFDPAPNTVFNSCAESFEFKVRTRK